MEDNDGTNEEAAAVVQVRDRRPTGAAAAGMKVGNSSTEEERLHSALDTGRREQSNSQVVLQLLEGKKSRA